MKILEVEIFGHGGLTHYVYNLSRALEARGHSVVLATAAHYELEFHKAKMQDKFRVMPIFSRLANRWGKKLPPRLLRYVKGAELALTSIAFPHIVHRWKPDIIHIHYSNTVSIWPALRLKSINVPLVYTAHDLLPLQVVGWVNPVARYFYQLADHIIVHSRHDLQQLVQAFQLNVHHVSVFPHGDYAFFANGRRWPDPFEARLAIGAGPDDQVVLFFGFLHRYKGLDLLLEAWPEVKLACPQARLVVAGDPSHLSPGRVRFLRQRIEELDGVYHFQYIPFELVLTYFCAAEVVVLPYKKISQSGVLMLALSLGVPVVASEVGAFPETIDHNQTGMLFAPRSLTGFQWALQRILRDAGLRTRICSDGIKLLKEKHSWMDIARQTELLFVRLSGQ